MSFEWQTYQLDELCDFTNGFAFKSTDYVDASKETIEVFRMGYICRGGGFKEDSTPVFVPRSYGKSLEKYILQIGDVVIAMTDMKDKVAILGNTARIRHNNRFALNQRVGCIRVKRHDLLCPDFLYFYSNSLPHVDYLRSRANSGVQVNLSTSAIKESQLEIPPLSEQKRIASILMALDDRITLLRETNATLEAIAQALFKSWFVDFDPVRAKMEGRAPEGMDEATAALFPDVLVESELGLVPRGWQVSSCQDLFEVRDGTHESPKPVLEGYPLVTSKHITTGRVDLKETYLISASDYIAISRRSKVNRLDVLITMIGTVGLSTILLDEQNEFAIKNIGLFKTSTSPQFAYYLSLLLKSPRMQEYLASRLAGTTQKYLSLTALREMRLLAPPDPILFDFSKVVSTLFEKLHQNQEQSQTLANLRDTLLPRLISGALRVDLE